MPRPQFFYYVCISLYRGGDLVGSTYISSYLETDTYELDGLADGTYRLEFSCGQGLFADQWYRGAADAAHATQIVVHHGSVTQLAPVDRRPSHGTGCGR